MKKLSTCVIPLIATLLVMGIAHRLSQPDATSEAPAAVQPEASDSLPDLGLRELPPTAEVLWQIPSTQPSMAAFQQWAEVYQANPSPETLGEGVRLATERRAELSGLIRRNPAAALAAAVPEAVRRAMPPAVRELLEEKIDGRGDLDVIALFQPDAPPSTQLIQNIATLEDGRTFEAHIYGLREFKPSRVDVPLHGIALDGHLAVSEWPGRVLEPVELADAVAAADAEPLCPVSELPVAETGVALLVGSEIDFFCGPSHATSSLEKAAASELIRPPGLGVRVSSTQVAASAGQGTPVATSASQGKASYTTGAKRLVIARASFSDGKSYHDLDDAATLSLADRIRSTYADWSYGRLNIRPVEPGGSQAPPPITLSRPASGYKSDDTAVIRTEVVNKLSLAGVPSSSYDMLVLIAGNAPFKDAEWAGIGYIGIPFSIVRVNDKDWNTNQRINSNLNVALHELGHNLGLYHASNLWDMSSDFLETAPKTGLEYGDLYDNMGLSGRDYNARYKQWLNWLDPGNLPLGTTAGTYVIREHDMNEKSGIRGLRIPTYSTYSFGLNYELFVEYRSRGTSLAGTQPHIPWSDPLRNFGAQIRLGNPYTPKTWLLDAAPETPNSDPDNNAGNVDSPLLPGRTFTYSRSGIDVHVTNLKADPDTGELTVEVRYGPVPGNDPPSGFIKTSTPMGGVGQKIVLTAEVTDPEDTDLAYHWQIPGLNLSPTVPAVFPNSRSIIAEFPAVGSWDVSCIVSDKHGGTKRISALMIVIQNSPPTISSIANRTINEDASIIGLPFKVGDQTTPAGSLAVSVTSSNSNLFPSSAMTLGGSGENRTISLVPPANRNGKATITISVSDGTFTTVEPFDVTVRAITPGTTLLPAGSSEWRYWAAGSAPPAGWQAPQFNASGWNSGSCRFVYPPPPLPVIGWTPLGASSLRRTCYFRRTFTMPASPQDTPTMSLLCDDGAVVYLNGVEVYRQNMPAGEIAHNTLALASVEGANQTAWTIVPLDPSAFINGATNTIAVEVHDAGGSGRGGSGDVAFDLDLSLRAAPIVNFGGRAISPEDQLAGPYPFTAADSESPGGQLLITATSSNQAVVLDGDIKIVQNLFLGQKTISCMPQKDAFGSTLITLKVSDGASETWRYFSLTITPVNDPPEILPLADMAVALDELPPLIEIRVADVDNEVGSLTVTATASGVLQFSNIEVLPGPTPDTRWLRLTPATGPAAEAEITVTVSDGAATDTDTFIFRKAAPISLNTDVSLVKSLQTWRYSVTPRPDASPADFAAPDFDDSTWKEIALPTGYNAANGLSSTLQEPYRVTTYYRKHFDVVDPSAVSGVKLRLMRDDGAAVYLNGNRVWISNLPETITPTTLALTDVSGAAQNEWHTLTLGPEVLLQGRNTVAVEVHQSEMPHLSRAGDLVLGLEISVVPIPPGATDVIIPPGDSWAYWDDRVTEFKGPEVDAWAMTNYSDTHWARGLARLGFGIGGETTIVNDNGTGDAVLYRKAFDVADPAAYSQLHVHLQRGGGAMVFLNGARLIFDNVSPVATASSYCLSSITAAEHLQWQHFVINPALLLPGRNLIAVSIHKRIGEGRSSFNLQLSGVVVGEPQLHMRKLGDASELAWSAAYNGWSLHRSEDLREWRPVNQSTMHEGGWIYLIQPDAGVGISPIPAKQQFFRMESSQR